MRLTGLRQIVQQGGIRVGLGQKAVGLFPGWKRAPPLHQLGADGYSDLRWGDGADVQTNGGVDRCDPRRVEAVRGQILQLGGYPSAGADHAQIGGLTALQYPAQT